MSWMPMIPREQAQQYIDAYLARFPLAEAVQRDLFGLLALGLGVILLVIAIGVNVLVVAANELSRRASHG